MRVRIKTPDASHSFDCPAAPSVGDTVVLRSHNRTAGSGVVTSVNWTFNYASDEVEVEVTVQPKGATSLAESLADTRPEADFEFDPPRFGGNG